MNNESGWRTGAARFGPQDDNNYKGAAYGWERFIGALEKVVAKLDS